MIRQLKQLPTWGNGDHTAGFSRVLPCNRLSVAAFVDFRRAALEPYLYTVNQVVLKRDYDLWSLPKQKAYFGKIVDTLDERASLKGLTVEGSYVQKPASRLGKFISRRNAGEIVLNPLLKYKYTAQEVPGLEVIDPSRVEHTFRQNELDIIGYELSRACLGSDGSYTRIYNGFPDLRIHATALWLRTPAMNTQLNNLVVKRYCQSTRELDLEASRIVSSVLRTYDVDSALVTSTRAAANSGIYDILTEIAEMPETVKYLYGVVKEIITLFRSTRREVLKLTRKQRWETEAQKTAQLATEISSLWLQFRYAVMPLAYSANDAIDLLSAMHGKYHTFRDGQSSQTAITHFGREYKVDVVERCFLKRRYDAETSSMDFLKFDVAATAWELVPLSFVVDWAFNVGDFLSALGVPDAVTQEACQYSWKTSQSLSVQTPVGSTIVVDMEIYQARPINPGDHIGLNLDVFMNIKRTLDALALSWVMFRKKR